MSLKWLQFSPDSAHFTKGDGTCDGLLNIELCEYDGGDCCLQEEIENCHDYECACHLNQGISKSRVKNDWKKLSLTVP